MDTKAYIASGIIESYVLGLSSAEETVELEQLCTQYEDIRNAVDEFAAMMETQAFNNAVPPPPMVKDKVMHAIADEQEQKVVPIGRAIDAQDEMPSISKQRSSWRFIAAASIILLVASTVLNFYFYNNYKSADTKYQALLTDRNSLQASNDVFQTKLNGLEQSMRIIQNPDVEKINLPGIKGHENSLAAIYWDTKSKDVYLMPTKMDSLPGDKQYQLWAIVDGKPVDAGVIGDCNGLCKMKNIPKAQAFAITLEKKGGSVTPTLSAMYVMGKV